MSPVALPDQHDVRDVDEELVDLLCQDQAWLEETFRDIVAASWAEPPRGGEARSAARPRRQRWSRSWGPQRRAVATSQWVASPGCRQRSPPPGRRPPTFPPS